MGGDRDRQCGAQIGWDLPEVFTRSLLLQSGDRGGGKMGGFWTWSFEGKFFFFGVFVGF